MSHDLDSQLADGPDAAGAVLRFLTADPDWWEDLAGPVVAGVGRERLAAIVARTGERVGGITRVTDEPAGLVIHGPAGRVLAWARVAPDGVLTGLSIDPGPYPGDAAPTASAARRALTLALPRAALLVPVWECWRAGSWSLWLAGALVAVGVWIRVRFIGSLLAVPWRQRALWAVPLALVLASGFRVWSKPFGRFGLLVAVEAAAVAALAGLIVRARRHQWGARSRPLRFPLPSGRWYVVQGGGPLLNHHTSVPEQRGALDLVKVGSTGTRGGRADTLTAFHSYGQPVTAPCDGTVTSAVDGIEDQRPGIIRYSPLYGNHVFIDTGHEVVKLAHLRPGSVRVRPGDTVREGQIVGEVGNSGNTTEPHLHIHAERDGLGLDLAFRDVDGRLARGRVIRA